MKVWLAMLLSASACALAPGAEHEHQHAVLPPGETIPGESIYQLPLKMTDRHGRPLSLTAMRGKPALVTMFYTSCDGVCPMLAFSMRRMEAALAPEQRKRLGILMVSFDPQRDTQQALNKFAKLHKLEDPSWVLARTPESSVRELAAVLGIRYRPLPGGAFSHSTVILLLDKQGVIRARTSNLAERDADFMRALNRELK